VKTTILAAACAVALQGTTGAQAQIYPSKPITMIVPFAAGGPADALARVVGERMRGPLGQPVIIENVAGATGTIGVARVVQAAPDGHTIGIGHVGTHVQNGALHQLPYDLLKDLEPIALLPANPSLIVAKKALPASDLKELIAWLKANPDKASAGTAGIGSGAHIALAYLQSATGTRFQIVPYRGGGAVLNDLVAGHIDLTIDQVSNSIAMVRSGSVRAFAITSKARLAAAPDIPTVAEAGLPGLEMSTWYGLWAPKSTPRDSTVKLNAAVVESLADPALRARFTELGMEIPPLERQSPEALGALQKAEAEKWWPIIKAAGIKIE
jgi:tripartite-type tricarboxylate transporter receptor subunit TctC